MAAVIGEAAAVTGVVSLAVQLFDGCVKGFVLLSAAVGLGSKGDVLRCQLEWEHYHLNEWAAAVGLTKVPAEINVPFASIPIVHRTLTNLEQLLTSATKLKKDYGLELDITDEELKAVQAPKRFFGRVLGSMKPQFVNDTAKVYSRRNGIWKKVKWASADAESLSMLVTDISSLREQLQSLLTPSDIMNVKSNSDAVMRTIVAQSPDKELRDMISGPLKTANEAIAASARLREKGLLVQVLDSPGEKALSENFSTRAENTTKPRLQLDARLLLSTLGQSSRHVSRELGEFQGRTVVVEWKDVDSSTESRLKYRVANVAGLLAEMQDPSFHSLRCIGFVKESRSGRYAYLFDPPNITGSTGTNASQVAHSVVMKSLNELLTHGAQRPSLNRRLDIAIGLAETVLQLHTAGWLHKSIRAENPIFFSSNATDWDNENALPPAFLGGYDFARADNLLEMTEDPSATQNSRLYRHPLSLGQGRTPFNKAFDLYSLGCVLLELGFWCPLESILLLWFRSADLRSPRMAANTAELPLKADNDPEHFSLESKKEELLRRTGRGSIYAELEFVMGEAYSGLVRKCLCAADQDADATALLAGDLSVQIEILTTLRSLAAVM